MYEYEWIEWIITSCMSVDWQATRFSPTIGQTRSKPRTWTWTWFSIKSTRTDLHNIPPNTHLGWGAAHAVWTWSDLLELFLFFSHLRSLAGVKLYKNLLQSELNHSAIDTRLNSHNLFVAHFPLLAFNSIASWKSARRIDEKKSSAHTAIAIQLLLDSSFRLCIGCWSIFCENSPRPHPATPIETKEQQYPTLFNWLEFIHSFNTLAECDDNWIIIN